MSSCLPFSSHFEHFSEPGAESRMRADSSNLPLCPYYFRVACYATQLLHKSFWCFFRVSEAIWWILGASELRERGLRRKLAPKAPSRKCHFRGVLGRPRLAQSCSRALLAALGCSRLLLDCSWLLLAAPGCSQRFPPPSAKHHPRQ